LREGETSVNLYLSINQYPPEAIFPWNRLEACFTLGTINDTISALRRLVNFVFLTELVAA